MAVTHANIGPFGGSGSYNPVPGGYLGVNATATSPDRLTVKSAGSLFDSEGAGHRLKINKATTSDSASVLFQTGFTGHAEMGLSGGDDFSIKTSDGTSWFTSLQCNSADGRVSFPVGISGRIPVYDTGNSLFIGEGAGANDDLSNNYNVFLGHQSGQYNVDGFNNTAVGYGSLRFNTTGSSNVADGYAALFNNTTGFNNTGSGYAVLYSNTTGARGTAFGYSALRSNTTGDNNTSFGAYSMYSNTSGTANFASGYVALYTNTTGGSNTATGYAALYNNTTGSGNTAIGRDAGRYTNAGAVNATSSNSIYIGRDARASADGNTNEMVIGHAGRGNGSNTVTLGDSNITGAFVQVAWTVVSDRRDKVHLGEVPHGLDFVKRLSPVAFRYSDKRGGKATGPARYGFYAQDVLALEGDPVIVNADEADRLKLNETALIPVLVNALKEMAEQVEYLRAQIEGAKNG